MKLNKLMLVFSLFAFALAGSSASAESLLNDWCFNVNGNIDVCNGGANASGVPSTFDTTLTPNTLGTAAFNVGPGQSVLAYLDYDLNFANAGSFLDFGAVVGTPPSGVTYQLEDPGDTDLSGPSGFALFDAFATNALADTNSVDAAAFINNPPLECCDVAWALGVTVPSDQPYTVEFVVSTQAPASGFYLQQSNGLDLNVDGHPEQNIFLSAEITPTGGGQPPAVPEPATLTLLGTGIAGLLGVYRFRKSRKG